jgi:hypothetical protein
MKFGELLSKIEQLMVDSYVNETVKIEMNNFKKMVLENKSVSSLVYLYHELSKSQGFDKETANLYINESVRQIEKVLPTANLQKISYWVQNIVSENKYQEIDSLVYGSINNIHESISNRKTLIESLGKIETKSDSVNLPIETVLNIANKTIGNFIENLDENSKKDLSKVLMTEDSELSKEFSELKDKTIQALSNITESFDDVTSKKLQETIETVKNEIYSKINYVRLYNLYNNLV